MHQEQPEKKTTADETVPEKAGLRMMAVLFAGIGEPEASESRPRPEGVDTAREGRDLVLDTVIEEGGGIVKAAGDAVTAYFGEPRRAVDCAILIHEKTVGAKDGRPRAPVRMAVHFGPGRVDTAGLHGDVEIFADEAKRIAKPGRILISSAIREHISDLKTVEFVPIKAPRGVISSHLPIYEVVPRPDNDAGAQPSGDAVKEGDRDELVPFAHGSALVEGEKGPCFYCGSRKHHTAGCPSKRLSSGARGLEELGYLSMKEVNRLFSIYLMNGGGDLPAAPEPTGPDPQDRLFLAPWSFYELKRVFQLRFLTIIWNATEKDDWYKARESRQESFPEGGALWLARDCIISSQLDEAERFLERHDRQNPMDYRTLCGLGFVAIEKDDYASAEACLTQALDLQLTPLQRTYIHLLLYRVHCMMADTERHTEAAQGMIREALGLQPYWCPEAKFEEIIGHFRLGRNQEAISKLIGLVLSCRDYYAAALIAPELADFQDIILPEIRKLVNRAGAEAEEASRSASDAIAELRGFVPEEDEDLGQVLSMEKEMLDLLGGPKTLFTHQDATRIARRITPACGKIEQDHKERVIGVIMELEERARSLAEGTTAPAKVIRIVRPVLDRLRHLAERLVEREPVARCFEECGAISREIDVLEVTVHEIEERARFLMLCGRFFRDVASILLASAATALVLLPCTVRCLDAFQSGPPLVETSELWTIQMSILGLGGLVALTFGVVHIFTKE